MGEMVLRNLDDALLVELRHMAEKRGVGIDVLASDLLRSAIRTSSTGRAMGARAAATEEPEVVADSVDLLREDRERSDQPTPVLSPTERARRRKALEDARAIRARTLKPLSVDSTALIREDRDTR